MTCAISWGRCSLIRLLVVVSVVVVLVLLFISFPMDGVVVRVGKCSCPLFLCSLLQVILFVGQGYVRNRYCFIVFLFAFICKVIFLSSHRAFLKST